MDNESGPPVKRSRATLNGNVQLTECVREFKLPRQYPSMVQKLRNETLIETNKRQTFTTAVACIPKISFAPKIIQNNNLTQNNKIRTIKLKCKDGRDLGEVNVKHLPQNIYGKTITIAKNTLKKSPTVIPVTDKTKGVTIGVLTPINIVKSNDINLKPKNKYVGDTLTVKNDTKSVVVDPTKISTVSNSQVKPQVLVFQSGKNWHMVKIPNARLNNQSTKTNVVCKTKQNKNLVKIPILKVNKAKELFNRSLILSQGARADADSSVLAANKTQGTTDQSRTTNKKLSQTRTPDSTTDQCKSNNRITVTSNKTVKPKVEISQVCTNNLTATTQSVLISEISKPVIKSNNCSRINEQLVSDVTVASSSDKEDSNTSDSETSEEETSEEKEKKEFSTKWNISNEKNSPSLPATSVTSVQNTTITTPWRRKLLTRKSASVVKYLSNKDQISLPQKNADKEEKLNDMTNNLSILEKALNTVEDEVLREGALKALAECGIGIERFVPILPACERKPVKDSATQTSIFGLWENDEFVYVPKDPPIVQRIQIIKQTPTQTSVDLMTNPNSQDLCIKSMENPNRSMTECTELTDIVKRYVKGNNTASEVAAIFATPSPVRLDIVEQLEKDYTYCKKYDDEGLLNIHKAVIDGHIQAVLRHLMVLEACEESPDLPTRDGQTSLELAIRYRVSPIIVEILLDAGAEPTCENLSHDSALIIASRQSIPLLLELIPHVKTSNALDYYDSTGFAALHYCAQNGYQEGAMALVRASANINLRDRRSGRTPLFHAVENEHNDLAKILLENGAEVSIPNYGGQTIFNVVDESKHYNLLEVLNRVAK